MPPWSKFYGGSCPHFPHGSYAYGIVWKTACAFPIPQWLSVVQFSFSQTLMDYHLLLITLVIAAVGVVVLIIRSGLQPNPPREVPDSEERNGVTVSVFSLPLIYIFTTAPLPPIYRSGLYIHSTLHQSHFHFCFFTCLLRASGSKYYFASSDATPWKMELSTVTCSFLSTSESCRLLELS